MPEEEVQLIDYLNVIWKRRWLIVSGTLLCMVTALGVSYWLPKVYQGSVILGTGKIYSLTRGDQQEKTEFIEDPKNMEVLLKSDSMIYELKKRLGSDENIGALRNSITIDVKANPLIVISLKMHDKQAIIDGLTFLADYIINEHQKKFEVIVQKLDQDLTVTKNKMKYPAEKITENNLRKEQILEKIQSNTHKQGQVRKKIHVNVSKLEQLKEKIKNIEAQILVENEQIETDHGYGKTVEDQIKTVTEAVMESKKRMSQLDIKKVSPMEILFLQTTLQNHELRLADFKREINDLKQREDDRQKQISERQKQIADLRSQMNDLESQSADLEIQIHDLDTTDADIKLHLHDLNAQNSDFKTQIEDLKQTLSTLENLKAVSENTKYRTKPVVLEKPISPQKGINTMIAGIFGFMFTLILAFILDYQKRLNKD